MPGDPSRPLLASVSLDAATLVRGYAAGDFTPTEVVEEVLDRIVRAQDDAVWITVADRPSLAARTAALETCPPARRPPLYGLPFAVKDNIDVDGFPTTAGCPPHARDADRSAASVRLLLDAGAIMVGKTNLDQFATGLAGTRSPYGVPRNPFDARIIPGGSSSGSAVAVAGGVVTFALGTDTAGSGRVPAALNNIVGLKPTRGLISTAGVLPACRSLDCVSIFALTCRDAARVLAVLDAPDPTDPWSRVQRTADGSRDGGRRVGVPREDQLEFYGDDEAAALFAAAVAGMRWLGLTVVEVDLDPFLESGGLLYGGPWLAERLADLGPLLARYGSAVHPVTREILSGAASFSAVDAFRAQHRLAELRLRTRATWAAVDVLCVPSVPTRYTIAELDADPIERNARLGHYTTFANLLDLAAVAVPSGLRPDGFPIGVTLLGPAGSDAHLLGVGARLHEAAELPLGASGRPPVLLTTGPWTEEERL